jgi:hypothetical protein
MINARNHTIRSEQTNRPHIRLCERLRKYHSFTRAPFVDSSLQIATLTRKAEQQPFLMLGQVTRFGLANDCHVQIFAYCRRLSVIFGSGQLIGDDFAEAE